MSYQTVTGTLTPGAHSGSYNGQDAYNDMLVIDDEEILGRNAGVRHTLREERGGAQRMPDKQNFQCVIEYDKNDIVHRGG